jgi:chromosome segregation ATPase
MFLEQKIESILTSLMAIEKKVDDLAAEVHIVHSEVALMRGDLNKEFSEENLKDQFAEFKERWTSDTPEVSALKDTLHKLKSSLGGLASALTQQDNPQSDREQPLP